MIQRGPPYLTAAESAYGVQEVVRNKGYEQSPECMRPPQLPGPCCHYKFFLRRVLRTNITAALEQQTKQRAAEREEIPPTAGGSQIEGTSTAGACGSALG